MSCDYGVWYSEQPLTHDQAGNVYIALCQDWPFLEGEQPSVRTFYEDLIKRWPELDSIPEDKIGDHDYCPWSCEISHSGMAVVTACVWPMADKVGSFVRELATKHNLVFYDPQSERVSLPQQLKNARAKSGWLKRLFGG